MTRISLDDEESEVALGHNKVWYLRRSRLFERIGEQQIDGCESLFTQSLYPAKTQVFGQGDLGRLVYVVKVGRIRIARGTSDGREITIAILNPGDLFGQEVLFSPALRSTFATCMEESLLCSVRASDLYMLLGRFPQLGLNVAKYLIEQQDDALSVIEDLAYLSVPDRLLKLLERLGDEYGVPQKDGTLLEIRLTHADLASLIGCARETVSMLLAKLVREGWIETRGRRIMLTARFPCSHPREARKA